MINPAIGGKIRMINKLIKYNLDAVLEFEKIEWKKSK